VQARRALRLEPNHPTALNVLFLALHERGQHDEAIKAAILFYVRLLPDKPDIREAFERGYAEEGYAGAFRRAADFEVSHYAEKPGIAFGAAFDYMTAGDAARTLDWLEKTIAQHDPNASYVNSLPLWDSVRRDTRFRDPLRKMGLPADTSK
jgi:hypothetical protein